MTRLDQSVLIPLRIKNSDPLKSTQLMRVSVDQQAENRGRGDGPLFYEGVTIPEIMSDPVEKDRYTRQVFDPRSLDDDIQQVAHSSPFSPENLPTTERIKAEHKDAIKGSDYMEALTLQKQYQRRAEILEEEGGSEEDKRAIWGACLLSLKKALTEFKLNEEIDVSGMPAHLAATIGGPREFPDLLFRGMMNDFTSHRLHERYPELFNEVLELAIVRSEDPAIYVGYHKIKEALNDLPGLIRFIEKNMSMVLESEIIVTQPFLQMMYGDPLGWEIQMALIEHTYKNRGKINNGKVHNIIAQMIHNNLICARADYKRAMTVFKRLKKNPREMEGCPTRVIEDLEHSLNDLIPPVMMRLEDFEEVNSRIAETRGDMEGITNIEQMEPTPERAREILRRVTDMPAHVQSQALKTILWWADCAGSANLEEMAVYLEENDEQYISPDIGNILLAKRLENRFKQNDFQGVIDLYEEKLPQLQQVGILRGALYYAGRSYLELGQDPARGLSLLVASLKQFEGTEWEREIWKDYILPHYLERGEGVRLQSRNKIALEILEERIEEDREDIEAIVLWFKLLSKKRNRQEVTVFYLKHFQTLTGEQAMAGPLGPRVLIIHRDCSDELVQAKRYQEALDCLLAIPGYRQNESLARRVFNLYVIRDFGEVDIPQAQKLLDDQECALHNNEDLTRRLMALRSQEGSLLDESQTADEYLETLIGSEMSEELFTSDPLRHSFYFDQLAETTRFYSELAEDLDISQMGGAPSQFLERLGVTAVSIEQGESDETRVTLYLDEAHSNQGTRKVITCTLREGVLVDPSAPNVESGSEIGRLWHHTLEAACLEMVWRIAGEDESSNDLEDIFNGVGGRRWDEFMGEHAGIRRRMMETLGIMFDDIDLSELEALANISLGSIQTLGEAVGEDNIPRYGNAEIASLLSHYRELMEYRDMGHPLSGVLRSPIDPRSIIHPHARHINFYGPEKSTQKLREHGLNNETLRQLGFTGGDTSSNFLSYAEICCNFLGESEERQISVILDKNGRIFILGITPDHPLYHHITCVVLESLVFRVVSVLKPLSHLFVGGEKPGRQSSMPQMRPIDPLKHTKEEEIAQEKREAVIQVLLGAVLGKNTETTERKLEIVEKMAEMFALIDLERRPVETWPLHMRQIDSTFGEVGQIFELRDDKKYVNTDILLELPKFKEEWLESVDIPDDGMVPAEQLPSDAMKYLMENLRVQTKFERGYRLPIRVEEQTFRVLRNSEGQPCKMETAKRQSGVYEYKTGPDGELYRLKPLAPHIELEIGEKIYLIIPNQRSAQADMAYNNRGGDRIKIKFDPQKVLYAFAYDTETNELLAYTFMGYAQKDASGAYVDKETQRLTRNHAKGKLATSDLLSKKDQPALDRKSVKEVLVEIDINVGYKQGVFPKLGRALISENVQKRMVVVEVLSRLKAAGAKESAIQQAREVLEQEEE